MEIYLTVEETAETLKVSIDSVRRWLRSGKLRGNRYGRVWRVPISELRRTGHISSPAASSEASKGLPVIEEPQVATSTTPDEEPRRRMNAFLRLADELSPIIAAGQSQPISSAKISKAIAEAREGRSQEMDAP